MPSGTLDPALTAVINAIARQGSEKVTFKSHARQRMAQRGFDDMDVLDCLRNGKAGPPELNSHGRLVTHVVHRGIGVDVVVGGLDEAHPDWSRLNRVVVVTVYGA